MAGNLIVEIKDRVAAITINREERRNALDHHTVRELGDALTRAESDDVSVVVLRGAGIKAFSAGDDIKAYKERTPAESLAHAERGQALMDRIEDHPCAVIAAIEGFCLGGGFELALACDYRIAGTGASFGLPEVRRLKALPTWGGSTRLARYVGLAEARALVLFGTRLSAEDAMARGLVNEVVLHRRAFDRAMEFARAYAAETDRTTVALAKRLVVHAFGAPRRVARYMETLADRSQQGSTAFQSGMAGFAGSKRA